MEKYLGKWTLLCLCLFQVFVFGVHSSSVHVPILAASINKRPSSLALGGRRFPSILGFTITRLEKEEKESSDGNGNGNGTWRDVEYYDTTENSDDIADDDMFESTEDHYEIDDGYYDDDDDDDEYGEDYGLKGSKRRQRQRQQYKEQKESLAPVAIEEEHPMRTDEWLIKVNMSPFLIRSRQREVELFPGGNVNSSGSGSGNGIGTSRSSVSSSSGLDSSDLKMKVKGKEQLMKFARNGYVVLIEDGDRNLNNKNDEDSENIEDGNGNTINKSSTASTSSRLTKIGKWKVDTAGVSWHIPVRKISTSNSSSASSSSSSSSSTTTTLHYHADLILTKFQERPRMFRGVVCRDRYDDIDIHIPFPFSFLPTPIRIRIRKNVFRPVIATFTAEGIGVDTADTLYKNRGFGLSSPPPTPSQK